MPVLLMPPPQVIPFDPEKAVFHQKRMDEFRSEIAKLWNATTQEETKFGAFRRARSYAWSESFDGLAQTYFLYPAFAKTNENELAKIAVLFRKDNCQLLGSSVIWGTTWASSLPTELPQLELSQLKSAVTRKTPTGKSPIRLSLDAVGYWNFPLAWLTEAYVSERLAAEGLVVQSDLAGLACYRETRSKSDASTLQKDPLSQSQTSDKKPTDDSPNTASVLPQWKRGHRQVKIKIQGYAPRNPQKWPQISGLINYLSLPLNLSRKVITLAKEKEEIPFHPDKIATQVRDEVRKSVHDVLNEKNIKVSRREGRFVFVERGLAYGLKIGMHLTGPDGAALHVIQFDRSSQFDDAAVLLIRKESPNNPIVEGSPLRVDSTSFPKK